MTTAIIIPARYASSRYPGKPLTMITGPDGIKRPLIEHTWRVAQTVRHEVTTYVATDDQRIADAARGFGAQVLMTSPDCRNGTERCADALASLPDDVDLVVNLQGDAPLTPGWFLDDLIEALREHDSFDVATPVLLCDPTAKERLLNDRRNNRVGGTTAIFTDDFSALYFSKEVLPFGAADIYHHVGVYAYRPDALRRYAGWPEGRLEASEGLEQLRFLENHGRVLCVEMKNAGKDFWEVNNPEDVAIIEEIYEARA